MPDVPRFMRLSLLQQRWIHKMLSHPFPNHDESRKELGVMGLELTLRT
jgi:hypothetical protein